jgi:hypothetical protein
MVPDVSWLLSEWPKSKILVHNGDITCIILYGQTKFSQYLSKLRIRLIFLLQIGSCMVSRDRLSIAANAALDMMNELISVMEQAAKQICDGSTLEDVQVYGYRLYVVSNEKQRAVVCVWDFEDYYRILDSAASQAGIRLDEAVHLEVNLPEAEFGENMVTGGFQAWKGLSVDLRNDPLELLQEEICNHLKKHGLGINCNPDEDVIFYIHI